jgi:hypothetical protein
LKKFKFDKGWKLLIYFDIILPAILFFIALITDLSFIARLFHSYEIFIVNPIINFSSYIGIIGFLYHIGIVIYTIIRRDYLDMLACIIIGLAIAAFFWFEINYLIIKPLNFMSF